MRRLPLLLASLAALAFAPAAAQAFTFYDWSVGAQPTSIAVGATNAYYTISGSPDIGVAVIQQCWISGQDLLG